MRVRLEYRYFKKRRNVSILLVIQQIREHIYSILSYVREGEYPSLT